MSSSAAKNEICAAQKGKKKSEFAIGLLLFYFIFGECAIFSSADSFGFSLHRVAVCCSRCSCTLYNNNTLKMYFPELSDSEDDDDDASYSACEPKPKPKPKESGAYEMQVNWLLPFAREQRFLFRSLFCALFCVRARDEFVFVFVHLFLQLFTHFCQFLCIYSICIHITCARVFICPGTTCSFGADATNSVADGAHVHNAFVCAIFFLSFFWQKD